MLLLLLNYVVLRALWKIDVHLISTLVNKSVYLYLCYVLEYHNVQAGYDVESNSVLNKKLNLMAAAI